MKECRNSLRYYQRAEKVLAGGVSSQFRRGEWPHPLFYARGRGSRLWDADGNEYLDFTMSQGPMLLGHSCPEVLEAVALAIGEAQLFSAQHLAEVELAEKLQHHIPGAERIRFSLSGSEAVHGACRLARAYTGRGKILKFEGHYHGWLDEVAYSIAPQPDQVEGNQGYVPIPWCSGIPKTNEDLMILPWNDLTALEAAFTQHGSEIAAVITEPIMCNSGCILPENGYLEAMKDLCERHGALLIFDEIITGFRLDLGGAQKHFEVVPHLAVFGKALGNGFPISALVGRAEIMALIASGQVIHAGTFNAQVAGIAAALATIGKIEQDASSFYRNLFDRGGVLMRGLEELGRKHGHPIVVQGPGPMFFLGFSSTGKLQTYRDLWDFDPDRGAALVRALKRRGIRVTSRGLWYLSSAHTDTDIEQCLSAAEAAFASLDEELSLGHQEPAEIASGEQSS